jgi:hypothetical protein
MGGRPGPSCIAAGWPASSSSRRRTTSCWKITSPPSRSAAARRDRLTAQIAAMLPDWTLAPVVAALQTMRGMALVNAATLITELGDLSRFANPRQLMAYLGLVLSEHSSGTSVRRGGITKAGNGAARRLLIEAAWSYRFPARVSRELRLRQESQPRLIRDIAWKGQTRLCARYRRLARTGKPANIVTTAIARELSGFVWAIALATRWRRQAERGNCMIKATAGGASEPSDTLLAGKAGGTVAVRRTLASTICRIADPMQVPRPRPAPRRISGHAVPIRASEFDQPSFRRPRLLPCPEELGTVACQQATNSFACYLERRT